MIPEKRHMGWQKATGYGRRYLVETAIGHYKPLNKVKSQLPSGR